MDKARETVIRRSEKMTERKTEHERTMKQWKEETEK